jgi:hypothetical protein
MNSFRAPEFLEVMFLCFLCSDGGNQNRLEIQMIMLARGIQVVQHRAKTYIDHLCVFVLVLGVAPWFVCPSHVYIVYSVRLAVYPVLLAEMHLVGFPGFCFYLLICASSLCLSGSNLVLPEA